MKDYWFLVLFLHFAPSLRENTFIAFDFVFIHKMNGVNAVLWSHCSPIRSNLFARHSFSQSRNCCGTSSLGRAVSQPLCQWRGAGWMTGSGKLLLRRLQSVRRTCRRSRAAPCWWSSRNTASPFFHKIHVFMLLENYCASSLFPTALSASLGCRYNVAATHVSDYLHLNVALVRKAHSGQPV